MVLTIKVAGSNSFWPGLHARQGWPYVMTETEAVATRAV